MGVGVWGWREREWDLDVGNETYLGLEDRFRVKILDKNHINATPIPFPFPRFHLLSTHCSHPIPSPKSSLQNPLHEAKEKKRKKNITSSYRFCGCGFVLQLGMRILGRGRRGGFTLRYPSAQHNTPPKPQIPQRYLGLFLMVEKRDFIS